MYPHESHEEKETTDALWEKHLPVLQEALRVGAQSYFGSIPDIERIFLEKDEGKREATCMDEGILHGAVRSAGSGILLPRKEALRIFHEQEIQVITSHEGCGAAALASGGTDPETFAQSYAESMAKELGIAWRHIPAQEMHRPAHLHWAGFAYVDLTGRMVPKRLPELPHGYVVSAWQIGKKNAIADALLAARISLGDHGFGERFTKEHPFLIITVGGRLEELAETVKEEKGERVRVETYWPAL